ncbi:four helix bundle protein [Sphingobacterium puteale]|uniref:Four helix bundle protein n=1 Tax=Sphingobacterium puteale TaxID=2420510 RepID=A0A420W4B5_9SPHI|nr:four helix bundle protein [Sphingobacterium puteale]RKO73413.1 four helix bundle protein [Sphingobacterium puteale]
MHRFQELKVWQKAMDMTVRIYSCTENLPNTEKFGLISQIRRSTISICSNIAEGAGRNTKGEFIQFLGIANGSAYELQTQIELAYRLTFLNKEIKDGLVAEIEEIEKMLYNLIKSLK